MKKYFVSFSHRKLLKSSSAGTILGGLIDEWEIISSLEMECVDPIEITKGKVLNALIARGYTEDVKVVALISL